MTPLSTGVETPAEVSDVTSLVLKVSDRCDACGAQAFVVTSHNAGHLLWCQHHFRKYDDKLAPLKVLDISRTLNTSASPSATI